MKIYILIISIYSCILREKERCIDNKILKNRHYPDLIPKSSDDLIQNENLTKEKVDIVSLDHNDKKLKVKRLKVELVEIDTKKENKAEEFNSIKLDENEKSSDVSNKLYMDNYDFVNGSIDLKHISSDKHFFSNCMVDSFIKIKLYMIKVFTDVQLKKYLQRLSNINLIYDFFIDKESHLRSYSSIFIPFDLKLVKILNAAISNFKTETSFVESSCNEFLRQLQNSIDSDAELTLFLAQLRCESAETKRFLFYAELINCVKYFELNPELMTLVGIFSEKSIGDLIVSIHLINILLKYKDYIIKIKVFVLFLIKKAFSTSINKKLDCFAVKTLNTNCPFNQYNLNFLLWEMNYDKRNWLKKKLKHDDILHYSKLDKIHFRAVILIFLYQHMIFLKYFNVDFKVAKKFFQLIDSIINENNCPDCDFHKFIILLQESNKKSF